MAGYYGDGIWGEEYYSPDYWDGTKKKAPQTGGVGGSGHWSPEFWANEYWDSQYWYNTGLHDLEFLLTQPTKTGGDDVPRYYKHKHRGWDKKAWKKKQKLDEALLKTIQETLNPPRKKKKYVPDYESILNELRAIDDEESAMLLL